MPEAELQPIIDDVPLTDISSNNEKDFLYDAKRREETLKVVVHYITIIAILIVFLVVLIVFLIRVSHFIIPNNWRWLTDEQIQTVDKFFFSGALGGILTRHVGRLFTKL